ncbi:ABC transporter permease [Laceyella putida]|uniref:ABC transporter permease n=1 Tax=Laceyella putida TaxID=110101 RepID=A0ABW2RNS6_9BACL
MKLTEYMRMAINSVLAHKLRSFLTMLGIVIGVASVIVIVGIGQGGKDQLTQTFAGKENAITLTPKKEKKKLSLLPADKQSAFTRKDLDALKHIPEVKRVMGFNYIGGTIQHRDKEIERAFIYGIDTNEHITSNGSELAEGRMFHSGDYSSTSGGVIISSVVAQELFPGQHPLGKIVWIKEQPLKVVGVLAKSKGIKDLLQIPEVYLPTLTWSSVFGKMKLDTVTIQVKDPGKIEQVGQQAVQLLHRNHNEQDKYEVQNLEQVTEGINQVADIMTVVIGSIGGISLLVGGIGVMNIMLVSVTERTREIGIRKALGATKHHILIQFLVEAVTICVLGGGLGIAIGVGVAWMIDYMGIWPATVSMPVAFGGVVFSLIFGVAFGLLPAKKAAQLNPIDCLRYE